MNLKDFSFKKIAMLQFSGIKHIIPLVFIRIRFWYFQINLFSSRQIFSLNFLFTVPSFIVSPFLLQWLFIWVLV